MDSVLAEGFDQYGFLLDPTAWCESLAQRLACEYGLAPLTEEQLGVLRQMRACYERTGGPPTWYHVCRLSGMDPQCLKPAFPEPA